LVEGDPALNNVYSIMAVNPAKHPHVNAAAANAFVDYLTSPAGQDAIAEFGLAKYGEAIFIPLRPATDQSP
jgi:tungstate transport system substrate-binding protein